jgi:23S rRNA (pseudouridine1915-N3)-methyltransferase
MKITIITIGQPKLSFAKEGFAEYVKRLSGFHKVDVRHLSDKTKDEHLMHVIDNHFCVVLDEHGVEYSSRELAVFMDTQSVNGIGEMTFVIGGPDGHSAEIKKRANVLWSMGKLTFPHDMAMMIMAEALYRASTINVSHPYHRE